MFATKLVPLFECLLIGADWLRARKITLHFVDRKGSDTPITNDAQLNVSIIPKPDGRADIAAAAKALAEKIEQGAISADEVTMELINRQIAVHTITDPDLLIFTGGVRCLQNGLLWQSAYTEFAFVEEGWRDLRLESVEQAIEDYSRRERRFGGLKQKQEASQPGTRQKLKNILGIGRHP